MLAASVPLLTAPVVLLVGRRPRSLAAIAAVALLVGLNLWWILPLADVTPPNESISDFILLGHDTVVMVVGYLLTGILALGALGVFSPAAGGNADMAHRAARRGDHVAAGEFWLAAGRLRRAQRSFLRAQAWTRAAEVARSRGRLREAADLFRREGTDGLAAAAQLLQRLGDEAGAREAWSRHAQTMVKAGQPELAIESFTRAGDPRRAAHTVELAFEAGRITQAVAEPALRAAREAKKLRLAAQVAQSVGRLREAGDLFLAAEEPVEAARLFEQAGDTMRAAEALKLGGMTDTALRLRARQLTDTGQFALAADEYEAAGLLAEAAAAFERLGRWTDAIQRYRKAGRLRDAARLSAAHGDPRDAAELFAELQDWEEAALSWERAGDLQQAATCFERCGSYERAIDTLARAGLFGEQARLLARLGRVEEAFRSLFGRGDLRGAWELLSANNGVYPSLAEPLQHLALWLHGQGETTAAISALQRAVAGQAVSRDLLAVHYTLAELLERHGDLRAAEAQWQRIVETDYGYRDAAARLQSATARRNAGSRATAAGPAAGAAAGAGPHDEAALRYVLEEELGRGGMGIVYRARDTRLGRTVAIKVLDSRQLNAEALRRFEREARAAAALSHPGIVHIYDFDRGLSSYYISMEYVPGSTLAQLLRDDAGMVRRNLLTLMRQIADAVAYAHSRHVVHRDLKPANMVLAEGRQVKILDFGIARRLDDLDNTGSGVTGTPYYMSPEQIVGEVPDERSDVYSLGVTFFQMATGTVPFASGNILRAHLDQPAPDPRTLVSDLTEPLSRLILSCLAKKPDQRPRDGRALLSAVTGLFRGGAT